MALPDRVQEFQIANIRSTINSQAWRTAHNPVSPEFLDYADKYGMLVWEENRFVTHGVQPLGEPQEDGDLREPRWDGHSTRESFTSPTEAADPRLLQDAQDMAIRDRNHPSVVLWSLCNELGPPLHVAGSLLLLVLLRLRLGHGRCGVVGWGWRGAR